MVGKLEIGEFSKRKREHSLIQSTIALLTIYPTETKTCPLKHFYANGHSTSIHNRQKPEAVPIAINKKMVNNVVYPATKYQLVRKKEEATE